VSVVCCQVEISASGRSLIQRRPTECGVSEESRSGGLGPLCNCRAMRRNINLLSICNAPILRNSEYIIIHSPENLCRFVSIISELQIKYIIISVFLKSKHFEFPVFEGQEPPPPQILGNPQKHNWTSVVRMARENCMVKLFLVLKNLV